MKKTLLATTITALLLSACGGGGSTTPATNPGGGVVVTPPPVETVVTGKAIKGTLANAIVTVFKYVDGQPVALTAEEMVDANIVTTADGSYTFTLLDYDGPVKVELSASTDAATPTTMVCDAPLGCGDVAFGDVIDITAVDPDFTLSAISLVDSQNNGAVTTNVSSLTHLAAALIEADESGVNAESVQKKSSLIANTFGIQGSLTQLEPTAVDNAAAVAGEDNDNELRYGLINAGIAAAIFSDEASTTNVLSSKFNDIVSDLVENNGALLINQDSDDAFELSITDVLDGAIATSDTVVALINADETLTETAEALAELAQLETNLENKKIAEESLAGEDGRSQIGSEVVTDGDAIAKASAMVEDVRLFSHLFDVSQASHQEVATEGDAYIALIDDAAVMVEAEGDSFLLLAEISDAITDLSMQYNNDELSGTVFPVNAYLSADNATGTITFDEDNLIFAIAATSGNESISLNAAIVFAEDGLSINLNLDGSITSNNASLTIAEGSFAKINLDSTASKEMLEDDSFDGDIISGELQLDVVLAQQVSDTVVNPLTFTGSIKTKLVPIEATKISRTYPYDLWTDPYYSGNYDEEIYKPSNEVVILPEMLSLSGGFSSLEGNLIEATLTVNITNLDGYQAPKPEYIGQQLDDLKTYTISEDLNTLTLSDSEDRLNKQEQIISFTMGSQAGEWSATEESISLAVVEGQNSKTLNIWESRVIDYGLDKPGYQFSSGWIMYNDRFDNGYSVDPSIFKFIPIDHNGDLITDAYQVSSVGKWNFSSEYSYDPENLFNADGSLITTTGEILNFDNANGVWDIGEFNSFEDYVDYYQWGAPGDPGSIANAADLYIARSSLNFLQNFYKNGNLQTNKGTARFVYEEDSFEPLRQGNSVSLDGYITAALIEDAGSITVSEDGNTITTVIDDVVTSTLTFSGENGNWQANHNVVRNNGDTESLAMWSTTQDIGQATPEVILSISDTNLYSTENYQIRIKPIGAEQFGVESFEQAYLFGDHFDENNNLVDNNGNILTFGWVNYTVHDEIDIQWLNGEFINTIDSFNPLTTNSALDLHLTVLSGFDGRTTFGAQNPVSIQNKILGEQDNLGEVTLLYTNGTANADKLILLAKDTTVSIDAYNTAPESTSTLVENETNFLQGNAALSLDVVLGDYEVDLQLSGEKTGLTAGSFDLELAYKLPTDSAQRSFTVHADTETEGTFTITNIDDVTVTLTELSEEDEQSGEVILGTIMVGSGDEAEQAAQIVDRDGLILVVYSDGSVESL